MTPGMSAIPLPSPDDHPQLSMAPLENGEHTPIPHPGLESPIREAHFEQLNRLVKLARPAEKAAGYAKFSGWTTLLAGALSLPMSIGNLAMMIFCVVLAGIGTRELTLRRRLVGLETTAPKKLALNQIVLGGTLIAYAIFMLMSSPSSMIDSAMQSDPMLQSVPELSGQLDDLANLEKLAKAILYAGLIVIAFFVQGGTALYYASRTRSLRTLHKQSPQWCVRVYQTMHRAE